MSTTAAPGFRRRRAVQWFMSIAFLSALVLPNLDLMFGLDPNPSPLKETVAFPGSAELRRPKRLAGQLFAYFQANMGFRGSLVRAHGLLSARVLGVSPAPDSVILALPWLFLRGERTLDDFRRVDPMSEQTLTTWRNVLEARRAWLAQRGIRYLFVVAPNKETIYAEAVPTSIQRTSAASRLEQLSAALGATPEYLDLTQDLVAQKPEGRLYHFTDTHWNDRGAFIGYRAVTERLAQWFPRVTPLPAQQLTWAEVPVPGGDLARICGLRSDLWEPEIQVRYLTPPQLATLADGRPLTFERMDVGGSVEFASRAPTGEIESAVILRDSFGELLIPYLARHFRSATWLWTYDFPADAILAAHPSVVIQQIVERRLMTIVPENPPALATQPPETQKD